MSDNGKKKGSEGTVRPSISVRLIRHAESQNNQVYRDARRLYRGGTPDFDEAGWNNYVDKRRKADPGLSDKGTVQSQHLSSFLVPHLLNQASHPVRVIVSPMRRALDTIRPTLEALNNNDGEETCKCHVIVNGFYHESEGCHVREKAEEGMNPAEIGQVLQNSVASPKYMEFVGFPNPSRGWYVNGQGAETRVEAEQRAAKFFLWLCEYLDSQLDSKEADVFDAGVAMEEEQSECEHDKASPRRRRRRTALLVGHGDFMGLVLKRIVAGFGHFVENKGVPHRSAFVHFNTGITECEYFGNGRFLLMGCNQTPHFRPDEYSSLRSGGGLKDGWSYIVPNDEFLLDAEVDVAFSDEEMEEHVREQTQALKALYLNSSRPPMKPSSSASNLLVQQEVDETTTESSDSNLINSIGDDKEVSFVVKRGLQVVGCASYNETTGTMKDVVIRPSARGKTVGKALVEAVQKHARTLGRSGSVLFQPTTKESQELFEDLGFHELDE